MLDCGRARDRGRDDGFRRRAGDDRRAGRHASVQAAQSEGDTFAKLNALSGDRLVKWKAGWQLYAEHPLGAFVSAGAVLGYSVHNDFLNALVLWGPSALSTDLGFIAWLALRRPAGAPTAGMMLAAAFATGAMFLTATWLYVMMSLGFYLVGWTAARSAPKSKAAAAKTTDSQKAANKTPNFSKRLGDVTSRRAAG